jgi:hypothetical protein
MRYESKNHNACFTSKRLCRLNQTEIEENTSLSSLCLKNKNSWADHMLGSRNEEMARNHFNVASETY